MEKFIEILAMHDPNTTVFAIPILICLNIILGTASAYVNEKFSSRKCIHGIIRYSGIYLFVVVFDYIMHVYGYSEMYSVVEMFIMFSIMMNIIKHYKQLGGPLPPFMEKFIIGKMEGMTYFDDHKKSYPVELNTDEEN